MQKMINASLCFLLLLVITIACKKKKNDSDQHPIATGSLTASPMDTSFFSGLVPLGNLNPPGHTFPTDHMYFYYKNFGVSRNIQSPGNLHIYLISRDRHAVGQPGETQDFSIYFGDANTTMYLAHVNTISTRLTDAVVGFSGASCNSYSAGGVPQEQCRKDVSLEVTAGEIIGTGGVTAGQFALDMGMRVNNISVCPFDYFDAATRARLEAKVSNFNGTVKRTVAPLCGEYDYAVAGTIQGNWLKQGSPQFPEDNHISLAKDNIDPNQLMLSIGSAVPTLATGVYTFTKQNSGFIDRPFINVTADGNTYCYNLRYNPSTVVPNTSVIVKLENATTLSFEKRNCDCTCAPFTFTGAKITYTR